MKKSVCLVTCHCHCLALGLALFQSLCLYLFQYQSVNLICCSSSPRIPIPACCCCFLLLLPRAREAVVRLDTGDGVVVFSDIFGATPCNLACKLLVPGHVEGVAGVNLPMLMRTLTYRCNPLSTVVAKAVSGGTECVATLTRGERHAAG